jgi:ParB/RepB/Spo0J family partition protein
METATAPALPATEAPVPSAAIASPTGFHVDLIPLGAIRPSPNNPRRIQPDSDPGLVELAASIRQHGVIQPIVVRAFSTDELLELPLSEGATYELVAGERRWHASRLAGVDTIPAVVRTDLDATAALELTVTENLQREDLHPLEEAAGVQALMDRAGWTAEAVADRLGRPLSWVVRRARLRTLTAGWRDAMETDWEVSQWSVTHLELVARLEPAMQDRYLHEEVAVHGGLRSRWNGQERVRSPREVALELAEYTRELSRTPWDRDDVTLEPVAGACSACPKRSSCTPGLFDEEEELLDQAKPVRGDRCLDRACWDRKTSAHVGRLKAAAREKYGDRLVLVTETNDKPPAGESWANHWEAPREAKGGKVPCLVVSGPSAGRFFLAAESRTTAARAKPAGTKAKPGEPATSLEERQAKLALRRRAHAIRALQATLKENARQPADHLVIAFAASFGTQGRATQGVFYGLDLSSQSATSLFDRLGSEHEPAIARLWQMVKPILVENIEVMGLDQVERTWEVAKRIAAATSVNLAQLMEAAEGAIPTPRAWSIAPPAAKATPAKRGGRKLASRPTPGATAKQRDKNRGRRA